MSIDTSDPKWLLIAAAKEAKRICPECDNEQRPQRECKMCYGDDPWGQPWFCPECDYCCGC